MGLVSLIDFRSLPVSAFLAKSIAGGGLSKRGRLGAILIILSILIGIGTGTGGVAQGAENLPDCKDISNFEFDCSHINSTNEKQRACVFELAQDWATRENIAYPISLIENCDKENKVHLYDWKQLEVQKKLGYLAEARYELSTAELASTYRDVSFEIANYKKFAILGGTEIEQTAANRFLMLGSAHNDTAKNCSTVDLRDQFGPTRNQGQTGYCFAFAVSDVLSRLLGKKISAWDVDLTYRGDQLHQLVGFRMSRPVPAPAAEDGGSVRQAFDDAQKKGVCPEALLPSEYKGQSGGLDKVISGIERMESAGQSPQFSLDSSGACDQTENALLHDLASAAKISNLGQVVAQSAASDAIYGIDSKACDGHRLRVPSTYKIDEHSSSPTNPDPTQMSVIDSELSKGNPVLIGYNANVLADRHDASTPSAHASVIVGRQFDIKTGQCDYIVRNSWGSDCSYDSTYHCQDGNIWIPKENLDQALFATYSVHSTKQAPVSPSYKESRF